MTELSAVQGNISKFKGCLGKISFFSGKGGQLSLKKWWGKNKPGRDIISSSGFVCLSTLFFFYKKGVYKKPRLRMVQN